jgi:hypothetical protein
VDNASQTAKNLVMSEVNDADRKVEEEMRKAKGGFLAWFGKK